MSNPLWEAMPDGNDPIIERFEWRTDVLTAFDGREQRVRLRDNPRLSSDYTVLLANPLQRLDIEALLHAYGADDWDCPVWTDAVELSAPATSGSAILPCEPDARRFAPGAKLAIISDATVQTGVISAINPSYLTLTTTLSVGIPAGAIVVPIYAAQLDAQQQITRFTDQTAYAAMNWRFEDPIPLDAMAIAMGVVYRSTPVFLMRPDWSSDPISGWARKQVTVDFGNSVYREDESGQSTRFQSFRWRLLNRQAIGEMLGVLEHCQGRYQPFWLPTFTADLMPFVSDPGTGSQLNVYHCRYTELLSASGLHQHVAIQLHDGMVLLREIVASTERDALSEQLTLDAPLGVSVDQIALISYLLPVRLDTDVAELSWDSADTASIALSVRSVRDEL